MRKLYSVAVLVILLAGMPAKAEAYLDPSTGSMVLQVVTGGLIAALATMRIYWKRIRSVFRKNGEAEPAE